MHTRCVRCESTPCEISNLWVGPICEVLKYLSLRHMSSVLFIIVKSCKPLIRTNRHPGAHPVFNWLYEHILELRPNRCAVVRWSAAGPGPGIQLHSWEANTELARV